MSQGRPRDAVARFAVAMEAKLAENDHKGGWEDTSCEWLQRRLESEVHELEMAARWKTPEEVEREAADVANYAMMIAEQARRGKRTGGVAREVRSFDL